MNQKQRRALTVGGAALAAGAFCWWDNNTISVTCYEYTSPKVAEELDGFSIVHLSDLHGKRFGRENRRLLDCIQRQAPNLIVVTGDLVDSQRTEIAGAVEFMAQCVDFAPVCYVMGNHEERLRVSVQCALRDQLDQAGVILLDNETAELGTRRAGFTVVGLRDGFYRDLTFQALTARVPKDRLKILLAHKPQFLRDYARNGADLVFAGHAHGGQVRLPVIGGLYAPGQGVFPPLTAGCHRWEETTLIISRGLGNSGLLSPPRVFNRPEVVVTTLRSEPRNV